MNIILSIQPFSFLRELKKSTKIFFIHKLHFHQNLKAGVVCRVPNTSKDCPQEQVMQKLRIGGQKSREVRGPSISRHQKSQVPES